MHTASLPPISLFLSHYACLLVCINSLCVQNEACGAVAALHVTCWPQLLLVACRSSLSCVDILFAASTCPGSAGGKTA